MRTRHKKQTRHRKQTRHKKQIWDYNAVRSVSAIALTWDGKPAGKIICNWSNNPAGSVCTAQVFIWAPSRIADKIKRQTVNIDGLDPFETAVNMIGKAGGYGHDKRSSAIYKALEHGGLLEILPVEPGAGTERAVFERAGFDWIQVI